MSFNDISLVLQAVWLIIKYMVLPVLVVSSAIWLAIEYWLAIKYWLQVASRTISWVFLKLAWAIIYLIDGKEAAEKHF